MKDVLNFLEELQKNNNKEWFDAHRDMYQAANNHFNEFAQRLIDGISEFDADILGVSVKDSTYRIYRDVRFSPNKVPYKTHMGVYICRGGKKSGYAGYYFHIEASDGGYGFSNILAAGLHCPEPRMLKSVRQEIFDHPALFVENLQKATRFVLDDSDMLKRVPRGYPTDFEYGDYLRYKDYTIVQPYDASILSDEQALLDYCLREFRCCQPLIAQLNKAVEYEMQ